MQVRQANPVTELVFVNDDEIIVEKYAELEERQILDDKLEDADYEKESYGTIMGFEISYWHLDSLLLEFFSERGNEYVDELFEGAKTSILELSETGALDMMSRYFDDCYSDGMLDYSKIRMDTPVGNYSTRW